MKRRRLSAMARSTRLLLASVLLGAGCLDSCDDNCDPTQQDCSLSVTCCTPPTAQPPVVSALALECEDDPEEGELERTLTARVSGGTTPYRYRVNWGDDREDQGGGGTDPQVGLRLSLAHTYSPPSTLDSRQYSVLLTATDGANQTKTCLLSRRVDFPDLDIDCIVSPRNGQAPLTVSFEARRNDCFGECTVHWTFGDGETADGDSVVHTYTQSGPPPQYTWAAGATLRDSANRQQHCFRPVQVLPAEPPPTGPSDPSPSPTPTAPANRPPVITGFTATPSTIFFPGGSSQLSATLTDPDGDPVTWTLSLDAGSAPGTMTPISGGGNVSSAFQATGAGQARVRLVASDGRGGQAQATLTIAVLIGE